MISMIACVDNNNIIGDAKSNNIPWRMPSDMEQFKRYTLGKVVVMGRKTWESIPEKFRPLPNRVNIALSRSYPDGRRDLNDTFYKYKNFDEIIKDWGHSDIVICGGGEIYKKYQHMAEEIVLTKLNGDVSKKVEEPVYFPKLGNDVWKVSQSGALKIGDKDEFNAMVVQYNRIRFNFKGK